MVTAKCIVLCSPVLDCSTCTVKFRDVTTKENAKTLRRTTWSPFSVEQEETRESDIINSSTITTTVSDGVHMLHRDLAG